MLKLVGIGALGTMLSPSAMHLAKSELARFARVLDRNPTDSRRQATREHWLAHGAKLVSSYEELIQNDTDGVVICAGKNGDDLPILTKLLSLITDKFPPDKIPFILHLSTVSVEFVLAAENACKKVGILYANYPLTGGAKGAQAATMLILASGNKKLFNRLEPILSALGKPIFFDEEITTAAKIKFISHVMVFYGLLGISSAVALQNQATELTISQSDLFDFLNQGAGGNRQWDVAIKQAIIDHDWHSGFLLQHAVIDAIYTADLLLKFNLSAITILPILQIACAFSYLLSHSTSSLATQSLLKLLQEKPAELENFMNKYQDFDPKKFLRNSLRALPNELKDRVKLDVSISEFLVA
jgi:3-hydroxyisobutyrate dehydrogenase-like beta-hydroxyacid dehydrogenase